MGAETKIEWCDHTFNPWIGCTKVSPGCANCYAAVNTFTRAQRAHGRELWGANAARHVTSDAKWREPLKWNREAEKAGVRRRVFCASMADVFEDRPDLVEPRARLFSLIQETQALDWLLLTKRPENIDRLLTPWILEHIEGPLTNVWLGTTVEDQARADERIPHLLAVPAAVRFLSVEPLLGPVDLAGRLGGSDYLRDRHDDAPGEAGIDWVIVGGESGPGARPCDVAWILSVVRQCREAGVPVFVKQLGANVRDRNDAGFDGSDPRAWPVELEQDDRIQFDPDGDLDGYQGAPVRVRLVDPKGGDPAEWPEDLRVREFPTPERRS